MFLYSELLYIYPFSDFPVSGFPALNFPDLCRRCGIRFSSDAAELIKHTYSKVTPAEIAGVTLE